MDLRLALARHWVQRRNAQTKAELNKLEQGADAFADADHDRLLNGLAEAHYHAGHVKEARVLWHRLAARASFRGDLRLRLVLFDLALQEGDDAAMQAVLKDVRALEGGGGTYANHAEALRLILRVRENKAPRGEHRQTLEQAKALLDRVLADRPGWPAVFLARAEIEDLKGNPDGVVTSYREALKLGERNLMVVRQLVEALRKQGNTQEADAELRRLTARQLAAADLEKLAADLSLRNRDPERAVRIALSAVREDSRDHRDHLWLGRLLAQSGRSPALAEEHLNRAVTLAPDEAEPWVTLVQFLHAQRKSLDAVGTVSQSETRMKKDSASRWPWPSATRSSARPRRR